jgi:hypothetical protein
MSGSRSIITLALAAALGVLGAAAAAANENGDRTEHGGYVVPGSLDGVNPALHPDIFGNPATAASYGFAQSRDGTWHVLTDWRGTPGAQALGSAVGVTKRRAAFAR